MRFVNYQSITTLTYGFTESPGAVNLLAYLNLQRLTCEEYHEPDSVGILSFVNSLLGGLLRLDVSLTRMKSGSEVIPEDRLQWLQNLFFALYFAQQVGQMRSVLVGNCYFYGVELNLSANNVSYPFYSFGGKLLQFHHLNFGAASCWTTFPTFPSVTRVNYLDAFDLYNDYTATCLKRPPPPVEHLGFWKFSHMYPNIQTVTLNNSNRDRPETEISTSSFLSFLRTCRALSLLFIQFSRFEGDFYEQLVRIPALAELKCLTVDEGAGTSLQREIDFAHLLDSFKQLTCLATNLVTSRVMLDLVAKEPMRMTVFDFKFWRQRTGPQTLDNDWYRFTFVPKSLLKCEYKLSVGKMNDFLDSNSKTSFFNQTVPATITKEQFEQFKLNDYAAHWLDN